jgi:putative CocE/NonD family hydrolase
MTKYSDDATHAGLSRRDAIKIGVGSAAFIATAGAISSGQAEERVSAFGVYKGYSKEEYDGWKRVSQYVAVRDGVKLAVDIFRPAANGVLHSGRLPLIWVPKRYQRAVVQADGSVLTLMNQKLYPTAAQTLVKHGYIIASVDRRGTGASFGHHSEYSDPIQGQDGYDITEWFAKQPWCNGKIGMFGASYEGELQLRVAATAPPHLKAIMPEVSPFDWYRLVHPGGVFHGAQFESFGRLVHSQDIDPNNGPVDADQDRSLLKAALAEHEAHNDYSATEGKLPFRDSTNPATGEKQWLNRHGGHYAPGLSASGIAVYYANGWFARVLTDSLEWYVNQKGPKKMMIGPYGGGGVSGHVKEEDHTIWIAETHRFFDYWLKGIHNGIMNEAPIHSSIPSSHTLDGSSWRELSQWPLPNEQRTEFFFEAGPTGSIQSANDGRLRPSKPGNVNGRDDYTVNYECLYEGGNDPAPLGKPAINHASYDAQGLTYTSDPLESEVEVTGHAVVRLWVTSTADDGDFFVKLEDVDPAGVSTYLSQGHLRASMRALGKPPYNYFGVPWISCLESDAHPIPKGEVTELVIAMYPNSYIYRRGHRMRVTITGGDRAIGTSPKLNPAPGISIHRSPTHASCIILPVIPNAPKRT